MSGTQADRGDSGGDGQPSGMQRTKGAHASASALATRKHLISRGVTMHSTHEETIHDTGFTRMRRDFHITCKNTTKTEK